MKNRYAKGDTLTFSASGALDSGDLVIVGNIAVVVVNKVGNTKTAVGATKGVFTVPKLASDSLAVGDSVNYLTASKAVQTAVPGAGLGYTNVGIVYESAAATETTVKVLFNTYHTIASA